MGLSIDELKSIKDLVRKTVGAAGLAPAGLLLVGFLHVNKLLVQKVPCHACVWSY